MSTVCYLRVSTEDQSMDRQLEKCGEYAHFDLGTELDEMDIYRDKSTGTDTERSGYREMMETIESGGVDTLVVASISRISRSIRDLERTVERLQGHDVALHIISEGLVMDPNDNDPYQDALFRMLGVFAQLEAEITQQRVREGIAARQQDDDYHHGPAPLGFEKEDGRLIEGAQFDQVVSVLAMVQKDELSKRKAARELDTSRATIGRALDRGEVYGL